MEPFNHNWVLTVYLFIFVKHFELPCVERCYINKLALPCLAYIKFDTAYIFVLLFYTSENQITITPFTLSITPSPYDPDYTGGTHPYLH